MVNPQALPKRWTLGAALLLFGAIVLIFGLLYFLFGFILYADGAPHGIADAIYFSLLTLATVSYGDAMPTAGPGQVLASVQLFIGVLWTAFVPALVVYRLLLPNSSDLTVGPSLVFNPVKRRFRIRVANRGRVMGSDVAIRAWLRRLDAHDSPRFHHTIHIGQGIDPASRFPLLPPNAPFIFNFGEANSALGNAADDALGLDPGHIQGRSDVVVEVEMRSRFGALSKRVVYNRKHIVCADVIDVQPVIDGPKDWENFKRVRLRNETEAGRRLCFACEFRERCSLIGKAVAKEVT